MNLVQIRNAILETVYIGVIEAYLRRCVVSLAAYLHLNTLTCFRPICARAARCTVCIANDVLFCEK